MPSAWLSSQGRLPLAFMILGLGWLAAGAALLAGHPWMLQLPHASPPVVALVHAWVLGFFASVAFGAVYQLAPVALGTTLQGPRWAWAHLILHGVGVPGMVYGFWRWDLPVVGSFGALVAAGVAVVAVNTGRTVRHSGRKGPVPHSLLLASGWLLLAVGAGLTLAANRQWGFLSANPLHLLRAHAHLGLAGFFVTLLQGVSLQLVPMFTLGEVKDWRRAAAGLWTSQAGLVGLVTSLAFGAPLAAAVSALAVLAGFALSGASLASALATRRKRAIDPGVRAFLAGLAVLAATAVLGLVLLMRPGDGMDSGPGPMLYGILALLGGFLPCIAGMMCKIVPFLTWMRAYGPRVGRARTPAAASLTWPALERLAFAILFTSLAPLVAGIGLGQAALLRLGSYLLAAGVAVFLCDMLAVLRHLVFPLPPGPVQDGAATRA